MSFQPTGLLRPDFFALLRIEPLLNRAKFLPLLPKREAPLVIYWCARIGPPGTLDLSKDLTKQ